MTDTTLALTGSVPNAELGFPYSYIPTLTGGDAQAIYALSSGSLPAGLTINDTTGAITGTPTETGSFTFVLGVTDGTATASQTLTINCYPKLVFNPLVDQTTTVGGTVKLTVSANGGQSPLTYTLSGDTLPPGVSYDPTTSTFSGSATSPASSQINITAKDGLGNTASVSFNLFAYNPLTLKSDTVSLDAESAIEYLMVISGGTGSYTISVTNGTLPEGLTLNPKTGYITGTPLVVGSASVTFSVTDSLQTATGILSFETHAPLSISYPNSGATVGKSFVWSPTVSGGTGIYSISATPALPDGLSIEARNGIISGTPTTAMAYAGTVSVSDAINTNTTPLAFTISAALVWRSGDFSPSVINKPFSGSVVVSGGATPLSYSLSNGSLPTGITLDPLTGALVGTPTQAGSFSPTITVYDTNGASVSKTLTLVIYDVLSLTQKPLVFEVGVSVDTSLSITGGNGVYSVSNTGNAIPDGVLLSESGAFYGKPTTEGQTTLTLMITDGTQTLTVPVDVSVVAALHVGDIASQIAGVGESYLFAPTVSGGQYPYTYKIESPLPTGLTLDSATGTLSGIPQTDWKGSLTYSISDILGGSVEQSFNLSITDTLTIAGTPDKFYISGQPMAFTPTITNGGANKSCYFTGSPLPTGLSFDKATGSISGSLAAGTTQIVNGVISVVDGSATQFLPVVLNFVAQCTLASSTPAGEVGVSYNTTLKFSGGYGEKTVSQPIGKLPEGLSWTMGPDYIILSGTPTTAGQQSVGFTYTDSTGTSTTTVAFTIVEALALDVTKAPAFSIQTLPYDFTPTITGGVAPYTWSYIGNLPDGIVFDYETGHISGSANLAGKYTINLTVKDVLGGSASAPLVVEIITPVKLAYANIKGVTDSPIAPYAATVYGGLGPKRFSVSDTTKDELPSGLTLDPNTGLITGIPVSSGTYKVTLEVSDSSGSALYDMSIVFVTPLTVAGIPDTAYTGVAYQFTPTVTGGDQNNLSYTLTDGVLPSPLTLDLKSGTISGIPNVAYESIPLTISVSDGYQTVSFNFALRITRPLAIPSGQVVAGDLYNPLSYQIVTTGENANARYTIVSGTLPKGLMLDAQSGIISGTTTTLSTAQLGIQVVGPVNTAAATLTLNIVTPLSITINPPQGSVGQSYSAAPIVTGGQTQKTYTLVQHNPIPDGIRFDRTTGVLSGLPTTTCNRTLEIIVNDNYSQATTGQFTLSILTTGSNTDDKGNTLLNEDALVLSLCDQYITTMSKKFKQEEDYIAALRTMGNIALALYQYPTDISLNALWAIHVTYKNTYFSDTTFFRGCEGVSRSTLQKIATIFTAFRAVVMTPKLPFNFSYVDQQTGSAAISTFLKAKQALVS